ncbi:hypothetical protein LTR78_004568 [Recurvomyces mirabilis]|uniref:Uncharacterized protein n=1 Tax=Recurvomyces mirabilis TaxID=574656 RepID=A0AAE0WPL9_9PEZI|nr:hypothetical protein LTR78_004568 [Recurvomyces mirabilis]KAK5152938.1 hypothetical protein LTS14_008046 [Recurvomyces mirabilis]
MLPLIKALFLARKAKQVYDGHNCKAAKARTPMSKTNRVRLTALLPVTLTAIALLLAFLCVYAGNKPGYMEDYAVFTLNVSRIGENQLASLDQKINSIHLKREVSLPAIATPTVTSGPSISNIPTTFMTMAPRGVISSLTAKAGSDVSAATSAAHSKATSIGSAAASAASSATAAAATNLIKAVNKAYHGVIADLKLKDFYSIHISSACSGTYQFQNGTNVTVGDSGVPTTGLIRILYWVGIIHVAIALILGLVGLLKPTRKFALFNIFGTLPALVLLFLASSVTHGVAVGAGHLINFIGQSVGIAGYPGTKFLHLTWATTVLLLINMLMWTGIFFMVKRDGVVETSTGPMQSSGFGPFGFGGRKRMDRTSVIAMGPVSHPAPVRLDQNGHAMI